MNPPYIAEFCAQLGEGAISLARVPSQTACRFVGVRAPPNQKKAARLAGEGGAGSDQQKYNTTTVPFRTSPLRPLTPAQRGRFWSSVGDAIEAARAKASGGRSS